MKDAGLALLMLAASMGAVVFSILGFIELEKPAVKEGECTGTVTAQADAIEENKKPAARATDPKTGVIYLRYSSLIVTVDPNHQPTGCFVRTENLDRLDSGALMYLGSGFSPGSPSGSSGGRSGSGGGVK